MVWTLQANISLYFSFMDLCNFTQYKFVYLY